MSRSLDCEPSGIFQASCVPDPGGYCAWEEEQLVPGGRESTAASVLYFWELFFACQPTSSSGPAATLVALGRKRPVSSLLARKRCRVRYVCVVNMA